MDDSAIHIYMARVWLVRTQNRAAGIKRGPE
jgi:hypothetical protein